MDYQECKELESSLDAIQSDVFRTLIRLFGHIPRKRLLESVCDKTNYQTGVGELVFLNRCIDDLQTVQLLQSENLAVIDLTKTLSPDFHKIHHGTTVNNTQTDVIVIPDDTDVAIPGPSQPQIINKRDESNVCASGNDKSVMNTTLNLSEPVHIKRHSGCESETVGLKLAEKGEDPTGYGGKKSSVVHQLSVDCMDCDKKEGSDGHPPLEEFKVFSGTIPSMKQARQVGQHYKQPSASRQQKPSTLSKCPEDDCIVSCSIDRSLPTKRFEENVSNKPSSSKTIFVADNGNYPGIPERRISEASSPFALQRKRNADIIGDNTPNNGGLPMKKARPDSPSVWNASLEQSKPSPSLLSGTKIARNDVISMNGKPQGDSPLLITPGHLKAQTSSTTVQKASSNSLLQIDVPETGIGFYQSSQLFKQLKQEKNNNNTTGSTIQRGAPMNPVSLGINSFRKTFQEPKGNIQINFPALEPVFTKANNPPFAQQHNSQLVIQQGVFLNPYKEPSNNLQACAQPPPLPQRIFNPSPPDSSSVCGNFDDDFHLAIAQSLITAASEKHLNGNQDNSQTKVSEEIKTQEQKLKDMVTQVLQLFPDADPVYAQSELTKAIPLHNDPVQFLCNSFLESASYPKLKAKAPSPPKKEKETKDFLNDWREFDRSGTFQYRDASSKYLCHKFKQVSKTSIDFIFQTVNYRFLPAYAILTDITNSEMYQKLVTARPRGRLVLNINSELPGVDKTKGKDAKPERQAFKVYINQSKRGHMSSMSQYVSLLQEELDFWSHHIKAKREKSDHQLAVSLNKEEYEKNEQLIECECCYDQRPFEDMVQCFECHLFCKDCLQSYVRESVYGAGKPILKCMAGDCESTFPRDQLEKNLPAEMLSKYDERCSEESVQLAGMDNLVRCPSCNTPAELPSNLKVFRCPMCQKETCRYCKHDWAEHFGKTCKEIESQDEAALRTKYEEKLAEALIRKCHRCKAAIIKTEGCNKMTCRCGAKMCYVCRKPDVDYNHFCQHLRTPGAQSCSKCTSCFLWADMQVEDGAKIKTIEQEMKTKQREKEREKLNQLPEEMRGNFRTKP